MVHPRSETGQQHFTSSTREVNIDGPVRAVIEQKEK